jgi:hypothetical protein
MVFAIRFQFLGISLSEGEQASFFAKWGDDIQSVISTGFQRIEKTLDRVLFFHESSNAISSLYVVMRLDREYDADEIGHFRAFCSLMLKEIKHGIVQLVFGSSDRADRMSSREGSNLDDEPAGIKHGISGGQWERHIDLSEDSDEPENGLDTDARDDEDKLVKVGSMSSVGMSRVNNVFMMYSKNSLFRFSPYLTMRDLDESMFILEVNKSLASKVSRIQVYANEYKLFDMSSDQFEIDLECYEVDVPAEFTAKEVEDAWVRIRPKRTTLFKISYSEQTPGRVFVPQNDSEE